MIFALDYARAGDQEEAPRPDADVIELEGDRHGVKSLNHRGTEERGGNPLSRFVWSVGNRFGVSTRNSKLPHRLPTLSGLWNISTSAAAFSYLRCMPFS